MYSIDIMYFTRSLKYEFLQNETGIFLTFFVSDNFYIIKNS